MENQRPPNSNIPALPKVLFSRYEIIKQLGQGGVGKVYQVKDLQQNGEMLALKILTSEIPFDEHTLDRFRDELALSKEINHTNVVKAYNLIEENNQLAYTMEFIDGEDLFTIFKRTKLNNEAVDSIMRQLLSALQEIHQYGVYHRDIKLENVMIRKDGVLKLMDLGLVKNLDNKAYTKTGILLGTAAYMPPEYIKYGDYDHRSDIYAAGIVLYELLTGKRRLEHKNGNEIINLLIKTNFAISRVSLSGVSAKYIRIIDRATALEPKNRFQSADAMRESFSDETTVSLLSETAIEKDPESALMSANNPEMKQRYTIKDATISRRVTKHRWHLITAMLGAAILTFGMLGLLLL